eukprot:CAMPEP_0168474408 /NCGR_PEP_ID=MMETSP0228-20121227/60827_1 /TAXON_ID=133427 /ORGANISM="Protoceratium reticulatum, Strain CCCM 535 (=CCMP 1889)" /LENGTH=158 /DNA_ID=CAMNT_0008490437 /DNA_START=8 /DNA_END=482 /DNA_ORIENTATION=-
MHTGNCSCPDPQQVQRCCVPWAFFATKLFCAANSWIMSPLPMLSSRPDAVCTALKGEIWSSLPSNSRKVFFTTKPESSTEALCLMGSCTKCVLESVDSSTLASPAPGARGPPDSRSSASASSSVLRLLVEDPADLDDLCPGTGVSWCRFSVGGVSVEA